MPNPSKPEVVTTTLGSGTRYTVEIVRAGGPTRRLRTDVTKPLPPFEVMQTVAAALSDEQTTHIRVIAVPR